MNTIEGQVAPRIDEEITAPVRRQMRQTDEFLAATLHADDEYIKQLTRHVKCYQGKRLRPALAHLAAQAVAARPNENKNKNKNAAEDLHVKMAAIVELIHLTTLVHDDVIDEASLRRRGPTVNARWDNETAVILGDYLFASAWKVLTALPDLRPLAILSATTRLMCEGELMQISCRRSDEALSEARYLEIISKKTAELFRAAAYLGALLTGGEAAAEQATALGEYGFHIGMAFQITDDCLDLVGTEQQMGKSLGTDLDKGYLTLPVIHALQQDAAGAPRTPDLIASWDRARVVRWLEASGSLAYAQDRASAETQRALASLAELTDSPAKSSLLLLAEYVTARSV